MDGVPALRLSHPTIYGPLKVGCDKRANANAGTAICEFCEFRAFASGLFLRGRIRQTPVSKSDNEIDAEGLV